MAINNSRYGSNQQPPRNRAFDLPPTGIASSLLAKKKKKTPPKATKKAAKRAVGPPRPGVSAAGGPPPMLRKRETKPPAAIATPTTATAQGPQLTARENLYRTPVRTPPQAGAAAVPTRQPQTAREKFYSNPIGVRGRDTAVAPAGAEEYDRYAREHGEPTLSELYPIPPISDEDRKLLEKSGYYRGRQLPPPGTQPDADPLAGTPDDPRYLREGLHRIPQQQQQPEQPGTGVQFPPPGGEVADADPLAGTPDDPRYLGESLYRTTEQQQQAAAQVEVGPSIFEGIPRSAAPEGGLFEGVGAGQSIFEARPGLAEVPPDQAFGLPDSGRVKRWSGAGRETPEQLEQRRLDIKTAKQRGMRYGEYVAMVEDQANVDKAIAGRRTHEREMATIKAGPEHWQKWLEMDKQSYDRLQDELTAVRRAKESGDTETREAAEARETQLIARIRKENAAWITASKAIISNLEKTVAALQAQLKEGTTANNSATKAEIARSKQFTSDFVKMHKEEDTEAQAVLRENLRRSNPDLYNQTVLKVMGKSSIDKVEAENPGLAAKMEDLQGWANQLSSATDENDKRRILRVITREIQNFESLEHGDQSEEVQKFLGFLRHVRPTGEAAAETDDRPPPTSPATASRAQEIGNRTGLPPIPGVTALLRGAGATGEPPLAREPAPVSQPPEQQPAGVVARDDGTVQTPWGTMSHGSETTLTDGRRIRWNSNTKEFEIL